MATALSLNEVLEASYEKDNYMKFTRLLMCGGERVVRGLFDSIIPPKDLSNKLSDPSVLRILNDLKRRRILTKDQWDIIFPPAGTVVKSKSFDITLLFKLLREICGLTRPATGWDKWPNNSDTTLEADLARIKYYRNTIYAHDSHGMKLSDDDFNKYWDETKHALLRIIAKYSPSSVVNKCEEEIDQCRTKPISHQDMDRLKEMLGCKELIVLCTTKLASIGDAWLPGSGFIIRNCINTIVECFAPTRGVEVVDVRDGSVKIVLWVTELNALERFWRRYKTGELRKDLERVLITEELKKLAKGDVVELEVLVEEEEYERAHEQLKAKEEFAKEEFAKEEFAQEEFAQEFERKLKTQEEKISLLDGDIIEDGQNKFQAHLAVITSEDQVEQVLAELKERDPDAAEATHTIWAYRISDAKRGTFFENCHDDGDDTAGANVLCFLKRTEAMDVMVVVSCWYETTSDDLGDVRFKYIQKSVLDLLLTYGIVEILKSKIKKFYEEVKYTPFEKMKEQEVPKFEIIHGEPIKDRGSTFQGHLADITSRDHVKQVLAELKKDRKIAKATYNMWACRIYDEKTKSYLEDGDDNGEDLAKTRLLHLLKRSDAKNVVVIVTRWHGGIHLGNDRFKHINKCASDLLQQRPPETSTTSADPKETKKKKSKKHK